MGGGASGPRSVSKGDRNSVEGHIDPSKAGKTEQTGGLCTGTQGSSNVAGSGGEGTSGQASAPLDKGEEEIERITKPP